MAVANSSVGNTSDIFAALGPKASSAAKAAETSQDRFLKLYVTQLQNQDPLNPLDNAQVTTQLAQLNTVKGIESLNVTLNKLVDYFQGGQAMQAAAMIGKHVLVPGARLEFDGAVGGAGFELAQKADKVTVKILDSKGTALRTLDLGPHDAGSALFAWDGKTDAGTSAPSGTYKFAVEAVAAGKALKPTALEIGSVGAVVRTGTGFELDLGKSGSVAIDDVRRIL